MLDTGPPCNEGEDDARQTSEELLALHYDELRSLATGQMVRESVNQACGAAFRQTV